MSSQFDRIKNFNVSVEETADDVLFLRKLVTGGSAHSFGIHVAKMAGMPKWILERSKQMLHQLEASRQAAGTGEETLQLSMFQFCLLYTSPSPRDRQKSRMPSSA